MKERPPVQGVNNERGKRKKDELVTQQLGSQTILDNNISISRDDAQKETIA